MASKNPETVFTNRIRKKLLAQFPNMKIYKHSDRFNGGIVDLHLIHPHGNTCWIEVKYVKECVHHRKANVTDLQLAYLREHWEAGIPAYVLVGVGRELAWYTYPDWDGRVYRQHVVPDSHIEKLVYDMERRQEWKNSCLKF
jgi:hypothetical protein